MINETGEHDLPSLPRLPIPSDFSNPFFEWNNYCKKAILVRWINDILVCFVSGEIKIWSFVSSWIRQNRDYEKNIKIIIKWFYNTKKRIGLEVDCDYFNYGRKANLFNYYLNETSILFWPRQRSNEFINRLRQYMEYSCSLFYCRAFVSIIHMSLTINGKKMMGGQERTYISSIGDLICKSWIWQENAIIDQIAQNSWSNGKYMINLLWIFTNTLIFWIEKLNVTITFESWKRLWGQYYPCSFLLY